MTFILNVSLIRAGAPIKFLSGGKRRRYSSMKGSFSRWHGLHGDTLQKQFIRFLFLLPVGRIARTIPSDVSYDDCVPPGD